MLSNKLLNLFAVSSLAVFLSALSATPVDALSVEHNPLVVRHNAHAQVVRKKRSSKRCKPRSSGLSSHSSTATAKATAKAPTSTKKTTPTKGSSVPVNSGGGGSTGKKVGVAWPNGNDGSLKFYKTANTQFLYTWSPYIPDGAKSLGFTPMPMLWGANQADDFKRLAKPGYAEWAMGPNEPNQAGQSDMSPSDAAQLWKEYLQPLKAHGYKLLTPAVTNAPSGKTWMTQFFQACGGCTFDGLALHYYGTDPQDMISHLQDYHTTFKLPIWPTEFACQDFSGGPQKSAQQVNAFFDTVIGFMESTDWVAAYFAFGIMHDMNNVSPLNQLMASSGKPTALGQKYLNP